MKETERVDRGALAIASVAAVLALTASPGKYLSLSFVIGSVLVGVVLYYEAGVMRKWTRSLVLSAVLALCGLPIVAAFSEAVMSIGPGFSPSIAAYVDGASRTDELVDLCNNTRADGLLEFQCKDYKNRRSNVSDEMLFVWWLLLSVAWFAFDRLYVQRRLRGRSELDPGRPN